jgi:pSer/pThr/pTyr-binding forkhead associated (FHA) protein
MKVKLKVLHGAHAGKELPVKGPQFIIGRGEGCHLRAKSDTISRQHCIVAISDGKVLVKDLGSKNGTFINEEPVEKTSVLRMGDTLRAGALSFEVMIDHSIGGEKKPRIKGGVREAAARAAQSAGATEMVEDDINSWLNEADELERARRISEPETRQFKLDETDRIAIEQAQKEEEEETERLRLEEVEKKEKKKKNKKEYGKLPQEVREQFESNNTRDAAAETLRRLFNRR